MALFGTLNVAGPAHRGAQISALAQNAAQAVLRRQRLKQTLTQAAAMAGGHGGGGVPMHSSTRGRPVGVRGATMRPDLAANTLAEMARSAGRAGHLPGGAAGGVFGQGGGGFDFGGLPAPADHSQSLVLQGPSPFRSMPVAPAANAPAINRPPVGAQLTTPSGQPYINDNAGPTNPASVPATIQATQDAGMPSAVHGWVSLGGGLFYDPVNDIVRGPSAGVSNGLIGQDGKF